MLSVGISSMNIRQLKAQCIEQAQCTEMTVSRNPMLGQVTSRLMKAKITSGIGGPTQYLESKSTVAGIRLMLSKEP